MSGFWCLLIARRGVMRKARRRSAGALPLAPPSLFRDVAPSSSSLSLTPSSSPSSPSSPSSSPHCLSVSLMLISLSLSLSSRRPAAAAAKGGAATQAQQGAAASQLKFYSEDDSGLKLTPVTVLTLSLSFVGLVVLLHIWGRLIGGN